MTTLKIGTIEVNLEEHYGIPSPTGVNKNEFINVLKKLKIDEAKVYDIYSKYINEFIPIIPDAFMIKMNKDKFTVLYGRSFDWMKNAHYYRSKLLHDKVIETHKTVIHEHQIYIKLYHHCMCLPNFIEIDEHKYENNKLKNQWAKYVKLQKMFFEIKEEYFYYRERYEYLKKIDN